MSFLKRFIASILILLLITSITGIVYADDESIDTQETIIENNSEIDILNEQLDDLYRSVGDALHINYMYVKILHMIAGGKAVYAEEIPNIYIDTTVDNLSGPYDIDGVNQSYGLIAPFAKSPDEDLVRPNKYYLPDAAYNVTANIVSIMNQRYKTDREAIQPYFDILDSKVKTNILFCEALLKYTGSSDDVINSFYTCYERILFEKKSNENVLETDENGNYVFKDKFKSILINNGISKDREIELLSYVLRYDSALASSGDSSDISNGYSNPYRLEYTSRENLMLAAMSVVGKVKYVWGGGHGTTGQVAGINPSWELFFNSYGTPETNPYFNSSVRPHGTYCPIHGELEKTENACLFKSPNVHSIQEYLNENSVIYDTSQLDNEYYNDMLSKVDFDSGVHTHRLDGLDCSGYMSWLFNQITDNYSFDSAAKSFNNQSGIQIITPDEELLPGDVFSWSEHVMMIVGPYERGSNVYIIIESSPNTIKFGVGYLGTASWKKIIEAHKIAKEATLLIGGPLCEEESIGMYNFSSLSYVNGTGWGNAFGRLNQSYRDEYTVLGDSQKRIVDMTAVEIIQHTISGLGLKYLYGVESYTGSTFDLSSLDVFPNDIEIFDDDNIDNEYTEDQDLDDEDLENEDLEAIILDDDLIENIEETTVGLENIEDDNDEPQENQEV